MHETLQVGCLEQFSRIAYQCLHEDRTKRPVIAEIVNVLQLALRDQILAVEIKFPVVKIKRTFNNISLRIYSADIHPIEPWVLLSSYEEDLYIWNYNFQVKEKSFGGSKYRDVRMAKFIAHREWIVFGDFSGLICVCNYNTLESVVKLKAHTNSVRCVVVHPSLPYILSASDDMLIKLWNWEDSWECIQTFKGHLDWIRDLKFNPRDTNIFASASDDNTIKLYLVSASLSERSAKIWGYEDGTYVQTLEGHTNRVFSILCVNHSNISYIITGSTDGSVRIWNAKTYNSEHVFTSELGEVRTLGFKEDTTEIIIGCVRGMVFGKLISTSS